MKSGDLLLLLFVCEQLVFKCVFLKRFNVFYGGEAAAEMNKLSFTHLFVFRELDYKLHKLDSSFLTYQCLML